VEDSVHIAAIVKDGTHVVVPIVEDGAYIVVVAAAYQKNASRSLAITG
jgi:predicted  nucleic acid-binding Zn-ribbon protein